MIEEGKEQPFLASRSGGLCRVFHFVFRRGQFHQLRSGQRHTLSEIRQQTHLAVIFLKPAILRFIKHGMTMLFNAGLTLNRDLPHRHSRCRADDALGCKIEHRRIFLRGAGNELQSIALIPGQLEQADDAVQFLIHDFQLRLGRFSRHFLHSSVKLLGSRL